MQNFVAIDVETAQGKRWSICQIGLAIVENGVLVETVTELVQPPDNEYFFWNTKIHGIRRKDTLNKPFFPEIWEKLYPKIRGQKIVAHNASFDISCLHQTMDYYNMEIPKFDYECTYKMTGQKLDVACDSLDINLINHHDAGSDANACAQIFMKLNETTQSDFTIKNKSNDFKGNKPISNKSHIITTKNKINFDELQKINPRNAKELVPKQTGVYFWFDNLTNEVVYIGVGAGMNGLYNRIVRQHLNPKYIEYRSEKHTSKDSFQLGYPIIKIVKGEMKAGIDQSAFRKNIGRYLKIKPGENTVNYILGNLYLKYIEIEDITKLKRMEKEMIFKFQPKFNNSHR